jgi:zinc transport system substrate-binding protein
VAVEAGGKAPSPRQLAALIARARAEGVRVIFIQPQFDARAAEMLAEAIGGAVVPLDPEPPHVLPALEEAAKKIAAALEEK